MSVSKQLNITPVILAGGAGKRLRPLTSATRPKPLVRFFARNSFLQDALERAAYFASPVILCAAPFAERIFEQYYEVDVIPQAVICEPAQRGTAAAIAAAAFYLQGKTEYMLVMPSDHYIENVQDFAETIRSAVQIPSDFVLIGVKPEEASSRYGYIISDGQGHLHQFIEKPDLATARGIYLHKNTLWNTGIFLCKPEAFLAHLKQFEPLIHQRTQEAMAQSTRQSNFIFPASDSYVEIPSRAVDHAIMERLKQAGVIRLETAWRDLGTWGSLLRIRLHNFLNRIEGAQKN